MKVKQLIYTSWKNGSSPTKGFMVYSKSEGITLDDENLITRNMRYVTLPSLPYSPTWEEIETLFPRNASYFQLPSGEWCMAQSSYLGKDYSRRLGNFIIHAFISPTKPDFCALNLIGSDAFRRSLTEEELEAESNPPPLPEIELVSPDVSGEEAELKAFFTADKAQNLKYFVAAVIKAVTGGEIAYVYDTNDNLKYWFKALGYCLPPDMVEKITYATYSHKAVPGVTVQSVKPGGEFNYRMQLGNGAMVYNFIENVINDKVPVGYFVNKVVDEFIVQPSKAKAMLASLATYAEEAKGDLDLAIDLSRFYGGEYQAFSAPQELQRMFSIVSVGTRMSKEELAKVVGGIILGNPAYPIASYPDLFKFLLSNGDKAIQYAIVEQYMKETLSQSVAVSAYDSRLEQIMNGAPFAWTLFMEYIQAKGGKATYLNGEGADSFKTHLYAVSSITYGNDADFNDGWMKGHLQDLMRLNDLQLFKGFLKRLTACGKAQQIVATIIQEESLAGGIFGGSNFDKMYAVLDAIGDKEITFKMLLNLLEKHINNDTFKKGLVGYLSNKSDIFTRIEQAAVSSASARRFMDECAVDRFRKAPLDDGMLEDFFKKYFNTTQEMRNLFMGRLSEYVTKPRGLADLAPLLFTWYEKISSYGSELPETQKMEDLVVNKVFKASFDDFKRIYQKEETSITKFSNKYKQKNGEYPNEYATVMKLGNAFAELNEKNYKKEPSKVNDLINGKLGGKELYRIEDETKELLAKHYFNDILEFYRILVLKEKNYYDAAATYVSKVLLPLIESVDSYLIGARLEKFLNNLSGKEIIRCISPLVAMTVEKGEHNSPFTPALNAYFGTYKRKKLKKLIKEITEDKTIKTSKEIQRYYDNKISLAKVGFFERLFGKKNDEDEDDQKQKPKKSQKGKKGDDEDEEEAENENKNKQGE